MPLQDKIKVIRYIIIILVLLTAFSCKKQEDSRHTDTVLPTVSNGKTLLSGSAINKRGTYLSPGGGCEASLWDIRDGGFLTLDIVSNADGRGSKAIDGVTGIVWINENQLIYTVSPIYGFPGGIFIFDCKKMKAKRILGPKTFYRGHSKGADYFELKEFSEGKVYFYYSPDVDATDFDELKTKKYLYQIDLDGTGFRKAQDK